MKRPCLSSVIYFVLITAIYEGVIRFTASVPFPFDLLLAAMCALFVGLLFTGILGLWTGRQDYAALKRAEQGESLQEGRMEAAIGIITPLGEPLVSPLQKIPCVAYSYKISHIEENRVRDSDGKWTTNRTDKTDYSGYALAPATIRCKNGNPRLLSFTNLDSFSSKLDRAQAFINAQSYFQTITTEDADVSDAFSNAVEIIEGDKAQGIRKDWRVSGSEIKADFLFEEQVVRTDEMVTALGYYSAERGGFVPYLGGGMLDHVSTRLFKGDGKAARKQMAVNKAFNLLFALAGTLVTNGILIAIILRG